MAKAAKKVKPRLNRVSVVVPDEDYFKFIDYCKTLDMTITEVVTNLIAGAITKRIGLTLPPDVDKARKETFL